MAAQIDKAMTFDDMESKILYTRAAVEADPDARDLLAITDGWRSSMRRGRAGVIRGRRWRAQMRRAASRMASCAIRGAGARATDCGVCRGSRRRRGT